MRMFHYRRFDSAGVLAMQRYRPLLQNETGVLVVSDTSDIPAGQRIVIDSLVLGGVLDSQAAQNAAQPLLSVGEVGDIWFRRDTGEFLEVVDDNGPKFSMVEAPEPPDIDFGGGSEEPGTADCGETGAVVRYDSSAEADRFNFIGVWQETGNAGANGGNTKYNQGGDQTMIFVFLGSRLRLYGFHRPIGLTRTVDGANPAVFNGQASSGSVTGEIDDTGVLPFGLHVYKITAASAGLYVDYVDITQ